MPSAPVYVETIIDDVLKSSAAVQAACGGRVYPVKIPQGKPLPVAVYQRIASEPDTTMQGYTSERVILVVKCFAMSYAQCKALALAVREALAKPPLSAVLRDEADLFENEGGAYCIHAEYACQQLGGYCNG